MASPRVLSSDQHVLNVPFTRRTSEPSIASSCVYPIRRQVKHSLDPLLRSLALAYVDDADLSARLQALFKVDLSCMHR